MFRGRVYTGPGDIDGTCTVGMCVAGLVAGSWETPFEADTEPLFTLVRPMFVSVSASGPPAVEEESDGLRLLLFNEGLK